MTLNKNYRVKVRIKLHTSPLRTLDYEREGRFIRETGGYYIFDSFRAKKTTVISITRLD